MTDNRYERIQWRSFTFDRYTVAAIEAAERRLGAGMTVLQGSYNAGGVAASAGTHDGGGAVDVAPHAQGKTPDQIVHALRSVGFAAWHRLPSQGPWGEHIHAILIGNTAASAGALRQVAEYRSNRDGLVSNRVDATWRPNPIPTFIYQEDDMTPDELLTALESPRGKAAIADAIQSMKLDYTDDQGVKRQGYFGWFIRDIRTRLTNKGA